MELLTRMVKCGVFTYCKSKDYVEIKSKHLTQRHVTRNDEETPFSTLQIQNHGNFCKTKAKTKAKTTADEQTTPIFKPSQKETFVFNKSFSTISSLLPSTASKSQFALTYLPRR
jgi:hypothetical protein